MSDKKKKVFPPKEPITPRRPVILKSDRETSKEPLKDKQEKEKAPTIILKTREQSTPKEERPLSPKTLKTPTSDGDAIHPSKIAQNEHKERKEQRPSPPLKLMMEPVKLIDENLEFNNSAFEFLNDSSTNYLVVGIIGTQGVGKSMILNLIAQNKHSSNLSSHILHSHEMNTDGAFDTNDSGTLETQMETLSLSNDTNNAPERNKIDFKFKMQNIEQIERGLHCTKGVDMFVTSDRVILLDCQALWSPAIIEESNPNPIKARCANVDCLQLASYLMSICHVLIAVQDWFVDYNFLRYVQAAEMLRPSLSSGTASAASADQPESTAGGDQNPHLLLLHNRCQLEDFTPESVKTMQDLYRKAFQRSNLQLHSGMYLYCDNNSNGPAGVRRGYSARCAGAPLNLFLLPDVHDDDNKEIYRGHPPFEQLAKRLRWMVLGVNRHCITNVPNLSEKGWFHYCIKAWETIRKCTFYMEYERFLP